ncbi:RNA polymerase factor sigma-54 [Alteribacillus sp. HJP-4]|uniref:RNA polymerase factor sigma-54 n=1 Tax=Alteribacillus sp. HJP-4 TaxID=2775394 RepID=UPI0035CCF6E7
MNLEMGLFQQQTMKLVMTQELRQAISLLQLSTLELSEYIEEQALENPLIDIQEATSPLKEEPRYDMPVMWNDESPEFQEKEEQEQQSPFDRLIDTEDSLTDYLIQQIRFLDISKKDMKMLLYLVSNVGDNGYLEGTFEEMAVRFSVTRNEYEGWIKTLQSLEPAGVGARSLQECLLLQLERKTPSFPLAETIIREHLEELAERKWTQLAKKLDITLEEIQNAHDLIQELHPHPGAAFGGGHPGHLLPDVHIEHDGSDFVVVLSDDSLPKIRLNRQYRHLLEKNEEGEATEYAKRKYKQLVWLLKSIDQRQHTLRAITEAILNHQRAFFTEGPSALKPLTLREIAEEADVHESTVSRTTTKKYVQTPQGLFELKYFFSSGMNNGEGEQTSTAVIKSMMKKLVEGEDKSKPFSDQKIADHIKSEHGISISRRAIAKYRGELHISSSSKRKRYV